MQVGDIKRWRRTYDRPEHRQYLWLWLHIELFQMISYDPTLRAADRATQTLD